MTILTDKFVRATCSPKALREPTRACSYLLMGSDGWSCAKEDPGVKAEIDQRRAAGTIRSMGDNCGGPPLFTKATS